MIISFLHIFELLPEFSILPLKVLHSFLLLLRLIQVSLFQCNQIGSLPKVRLKSIFCKFNFNCLNVSAIPVSDAIEINEATISSIARARLLSVFRNHSLEIVGRSMINKELLLFNFSILDFTVDFICLILEPEAACCFRAKRSHEYASINLFGEVCINYCSICEFKCSLSLVR